MRRLLLTLLLSTVLAAPASAYVVNNLGDASDATPGNDICATAGGVCTLRAAIEEANAHAGSDPITFGVTGTITIATALPIVTGVVTIDGTTAPGYSSEPLVRIFDGAAVSHGLQFGAGSATSVLRALKIQGFGGGAVYITTSNIRLERNYLGLIFPGDLNNGYGVLVDGSDNEIGFGVTERNVIGGNNGAGIYIASGTGNKITANVIGTRADGVAAGNNYGIRVRPGANGTQIGGVGGGNLISANSLHGIEIQGVTSASVIGNFIGTSVSGSGVLGNGGDGIHIIASTGVTVGGISVSTANTIAGNDHGIVATGSNGCTFESNRIGVLIDGTAGPNRTHGILLDDSTNITIGQISRGNILSGNTVDGLRIEGGDGHLVVGNIIGLASGAASALANGGSGIGILDSNDNDILNNTISGNTQDGVHISGTSTGNLVRDNAIGRSGNLSIAVPNQRDGVRIDGTASANIIGATGQGNLIRSNGGNGVTVLATAVRNDIIANQILENGALGIDLGNDGVTMNDALDADSGPNGLQNFPQITAAQARPANTLISGTIATTPLTSVAIHVYRNATADPSGFGEGERYLATTTVMTDAAGVATFNINANTAVAAGTLITAATTTAGGTSELSAPLAATAQPVVQFASASTSVNESAGVATITVTRSGDLTFQSSVDYASVADTATAGDDYTDVAGTLVFAAGVATQSFTVPIVDDATAEPAETLALTLSNPSGATLGTLDAATLTITDNDGSPTITIDDASVVEGNSGTAILRFVAHLSQAHTEPVTFTYATANLTATAGSDYAARTGTATIGAGAVETFIDITVNGDTRIEPDETLRLDLSNPANAILGDDEATGTITNDDIDSANLAITKVAGSPTYTPGQNITYTITVTNNGPSDATNVTITDVLPAGTTFVSATPTSGTCSGTTTVTCTVPALNTAASMMVSLVVATTGNTTIVNNAHVTADQTDPTPANNASSATVTAAAPGSADIPTLSDWALIALAIAIAAMAAFKMR